MAGVSSYRKGARRNTCIHTESGKVTKCVVRSLTSPDLQDIRMTTKPNAFSLIELLVVISIIVLLASMAFAGLNLARKNAAKAVCLNNLQQLQTMNLAFAGDHDGLSMHVAYLDSTGTFYTFDTIEQQKEFVGWDTLGNETAMWWPYRSNIPQSRFCPLVRGENRGLSKVYSYAGVTGDTVPYLWGSMSGTLGAQLNLMKIANSSAKIAFADSCDPIVPTPSSGWEMRRSKDPTLDSVSLATHLQYRHNDKINAAYWDGRADSIPWSTDPATFLLP